MATPVFCCGFECGLLPTTGAGHHWVRSGSANAAIVTSGALRGDRSLQINPTAATSVTCTAPASLLASGGLHVFRFRIKFSTLPSVDTELVTSQSNLGGLYFKQSDSKVYAGLSNGSAITFGSSGVAVTTGVEYYVECRVDSSANPHLADATVNGTACGQASRGVAANTNASTVMVSVGGILGGNITTDFLVDDVAASVTLADYGAGVGYVNHFVPTSDGTHNVAGANDFERTLTGTDILNSTTDAFQLVDDVPHEATVTDWINMLAPPNATDYVECVFGPAPGISTPTTAPRAVEVICGINQAATGTGNMEIRLNDNGTTNAVYTATAVAGVAVATGQQFKRKHYASGPAGAWVIGGGGNGDFTDLRIQFGSPAALDVNPDQYFGCAMIEAEFADPPPTASPGVGSLTLIGLAPALALAMSLGAGTLSLAGAAPTLNVGKTLEPTVGALALTGQAPQALISVAAVPSAGALTITGHAPTLAYTLDVASGALTLSGQAPSTSIGQLVAPAAGALTLAGQAPTLAHTLPAAAGTLALVGQAPVVAHTLPVALGALALTGHAPALSEFGATTFEPAVGALTLSGLAPTLAFVQFPSAGALALTGQTPTSQIDTPLAPAVGALGLTGQAITFAYGIGPAAGVLTLTGQPPSVLGEGVKSPATAALALTSNAPALLTGVAVQAGTLALTGQTPALSIGTVPLPAVGALSLSGQAPSLNLAIAVQAGALTLTGQAPTTGGTIVLAPAAGALTLAGQAPVASIGTVIRPDAAALVLAGEAPSVNTAIFISVQAGVLTLGGNAPQILLGQIETPAGTLALTGHAPTLRLRNITLEIILADGAEHGTLQGSGGRHGAITASGSSHGD